MTYNWMAVLVFLALLIALTKAGRFLAFKVPALQSMRRYNRDEDKKKRAKEKYPPVVNANNRMGLISNLIFFIVILPFFISLEAQSIGEIALDVVVILMVYDFFYYLTHRFVFHGEGYFRKVHGLHHQARYPTNIDAYYVHPVETFIGIALFMLTIVGLGLLMGTFHAVTLALTFTVWTQLNIINHNHVDLPYFPFKTLTWITVKHHIHHENMHKGNYATITMLYDWMFGTLD